MTQHKGFTLIELLVVVTIIVVLVSLLVPSLESALAEARKAKCATQQRMLVQMTTDYALDHQGRYPLGTRHDGQSYPMFINQALLVVVFERAGNNRTPTINGAIYTDFIPPVLIDPNYSDFGYIHAGVGWLIGYNYFGNQPGLTDNNQAPDTAAGRDRTWDSPMTIADKGSGQLFGCLNIWTTFQPGNDLTLTAHMKHGGPLGAPNSTDKAMNYHYFSDTPDPRKIGGAGGNIATTDGAVNWINIQDMNLYNASNYQSSWLGLW